ncbi:MAG: cold shock domain-containing protein [candidate division KSB1 bacterium]|nr:cold shock domain-containing protein [candidate division KSB1 bacterium]
MVYGTVTHWEAGKGYGFIEIDDDDEQVFLHVSNLATIKPQEIEEGMRLRFDIQSDMKGDKAVNVRKA